MPDGCRTRQAVILRKIVFGPILFNDLNVRLQDNGDNDDDNNDDEGKDNDNDDEVNNDNDTSYGDGNS